MKNNPIAPAVLTDLKRWYVEEEADRTDRGKSFIGTEKGTQL